MEWFDKRTASVLITVLIFVAIGAFIYGAGRILIVFLLAILFAYLLEPLVSRFQRWSKVSRGSREIAILEVYVIICAAFAALLILMGPRIADESRKLVEALPGFLQKISSGRIVAEIGSKHGWSYNT
ncbi:MAG TPA: AI-2E family transporter, partial [Candidatus Acidoferrales bacterium]|nr:AI-2E family transporter [Candidatus Acidoferrales bacterium]